jgi:hypothetical protein
MDRMNRIRNEQNDSGWPKPYRVNPVHPLSFSPKMAADWEIQQGSFFWGSHFLQ